MTVRATGGQLSLLARAVSLLARREHSRAELARKLTRRRKSDQEARSVDPAEVEQLLDQLEREGVLSDQRFAVSRVASRAQRYGNARLLNELQRSGVDRSIAAIAVAGSTESELVRARALWRRRFGVPPAYERERARQIRYLQARGFSSDTIRGVLRAREEA
jgi:regulatory protein